MASMCGLGRTSNSALLESLRVGDLKFPRAQKCQTSMHGPSDHPTPLRPLEGGSARPAKAANLSFFISRDEEFPEL